MTMLCGVVMSETCAGLSSGREAAEEIDARVGLDECDLDAVERSRVGEDNSALREIERLWGKVLHSLRGQSNDILFEIGDLQCEVIEAFASRLDEPGYRAPGIVGGNEAERSVAEIEAGPLEAGVGVIAVRQHPRGDTQDSGVGRDC